MHSGDTYRLQATTKLALNPVVLVFLKIGTPKSRNHHTRETLKGHSQTYTVGNMTPIHLLCFDGAKLDRFWGGKGRDICWLDAEQTV